MFAFFLCVTSHLSIYIYIYLGFCTHAWFPVCVGVFLCEKKLY